MCIALTKKDVACKRKAIDNEGYCELHSPKYKLKRTLMKEIEHDFNFEETNLTNLQTELLAIYTRNYETIFRKMFDMQENELAQTTNKILNGLDYIQSTIMLRGLKHEIVKITEKVEKDKEKFVKYGNYLLSMYRAGFEIINYQMQFFKCKKTRVAPHLSFDGKVSVIKEEWKFWKERFNLITEKLVQFCMEQNPEERLRPFTIEITFNPSQQVLMMEEDEDEEEYEDDSDEEDDDDSE